MNQATGRQWSPRTSSQGELLSGLSLIFIFSLGMAATLVAIDIVMVRAASFAQRYISESKWVRIVPVGSACLITLVGLLLTVHAVKALRMRDRTGTTRKAERPERNPSVAYSNLFALEICDEIW